MSTSETDEDAARDVEEGTVEMVSLRAEAADTGSKAGSGEFPRVRGEGYQALPTSATPHDGLADEEPHEADAGGVAGGRRDREEGGAAHHAPDMSEGGPRSPGIANANVDANANASANANTNTNANASANTNANGRVARSRGEGAGPGWWGQYVAFARLLSEKRVREAMILYGSLSVSVGALVVLRASALAPQLREGRRGRIRIELI